MADTPMSLSDMIVPEVFYRYTQQYSTVRTDFWSSGIVADLSGLIGDLGGTTVNLPFFNDLSGDTVVIDDDEDLEIRKLSTGMEVAARLFRAFAYGGTDLAADLAGADPMQSILTNVGGLWARNLQQDLLASVGGAMSAASMASNVYDISGTAGAGGVFDGEFLLDGKQKLGDHGETLAGIAVHSATHTLMQKQDLIDYVADSQGGKMIPYYMGKRVIITDSMPTSGSGANTVYTSYLFGPGAIGYAEKPVKKPVGVDRDELKSMGMEFIAMRRTYALHPRGIKWKGTPAKSTASNAELATGTNWERVVDPKLVRIVALKHRNA